MRQWIGVCSILAIALQGYVPALAASGSVVSLRMGQEPESVNMAFPLGVCNLAEGGERVVSVATAGQSIELTPLGIGRTVLEVRDGAGVKRAELTILVMERLLSLEAIKQVLVDGDNKPIPTLDVSLLPGGDMAKITGQIVLQRDLSRMLKLKEVFGDRVVDLTEINPAFFEKFTKEVKERVASPNIEVSHSGDTLFLSGMAFSDLEKQQIEALAQSVYPKVKSFIAVRPGPQYEDYVLEKPLVQLECQIMEIKKSAAKSLGIDWGGLVPVTVSAQYKAESGSSPSGFISLDTSKLIGAIIPQVQDGNAKVLYSQTIICETGEKAKFFAGGSFWIVAHLAGTESISTEEVEYGISLGIEPKTDKHGNVQSVVNIEFSNLGEVINGYPSLLKRYVRTSINVKRDQTLSLGGLLGSETRDAVSKIPALGNIPVLGNLFKSTDYQEGNSEMVIFITPRVVIPGGKDDLGLRERIKAQMYVPSKTDLRVKD